MDAETREFMRIRLLQMMDKAHPTALGLDRLRTGLVMAGVELERPALRSELAALVELGDAKVTPGALAGEVDYWTRTESGRVKLARLGVI